MPMTMPQPPPRYPLSPYRQDRVATSLLVVIAIYSALITSDQITGQNVFYTVPAMQVAYVTILDVLLALLFGYSLINGLVAYLANARAMLFVGMGVALALVSGLAGSFVSGYERAGLVGPELRGGVEWLVLLACTAFWLSRQRSSAMTLIGAFTAAYLCRCLIEIFVFRTGLSMLVENWVIDSSTLLVLSCLGIFWFTLFAYSNIARPLPAILSALLIAIVVIAFRRSAIIVMACGVLIAIYYGLSVERKMKNVAGVVVAFGVFVVLVFLGGLQTRVFGTVADRFKGIFDESYRIGSDREHLEDMDDAFAVIKEKPIFGAGMGTEVPNRTLSKYGAVMPFHSSYYHTWVRLGIVGLLGYLCLLWYLFHLSLGRRAFGSSRADSYNAIVRGAAVAALTLALFLVKFPPFYLDQKLIVGLGLLMGIPMAEASRLQGVRRMATSRR